MTNELAVQAIPGTLTPTSLALPSDLTRERWVEVGYTLRAMEKGIQFWVGDWLAYGEDRYCEDAFAEMDCSDKTLANWASTCRRVAPERRLPDVGFSHHAEVAPLPPEKQTEVLEEVRTENYTVGQTRERVREEQQMEAEEDHGPAEVIRMMKCPRCQGEGEVIVE